MMDKVPEIYQALPRIQKVILHPEVCLLPTRYESSVYHLGRKLGIPFFSQFQVSSFIHIKSFASFIFFPSVFLIVLQLGKKLFQAFTNFYCGKSLFYMTLHSLTLMMNSWLKMSKALQLQTWMDFKVIKITPRQNYVTSDTLILVLKFTTKQFFFSRIHGNSSLFLLILLLIFMTSSRSSSGTALQSGDCNNKIHLCVYFLFSNCSTYSIIISNTCIVAMYLLLSALQSYNKFGHNVL